MRVQETLDTEATAEKTEEIPAPLAAWMNSGVPIDGTAQTLLQTPTAAHESPVEGCRGFHPNPTHPSVAVGWIESSTDDGEEHGRWWWTVRFRGEVKGGEVVTGPRNVL